MISHETPYYPLKEEERIHFVLLIFDYDSKNITITNIGELSTLNNKQENLMDQLYKLISNLFIPIFHHI